MKRLMGLMIGILISASVFSQNISEENLPVKATIDTTGYTYIMIGAGFQTEEVIKDLKRVDIYKNENTILRRNINLYKKQKTLYIEQIDTLNSQVAVLKEINKNKDGQIDTLTAALKESEDENDLLFDITGEQDKKINEQKEKIKRKNRKIIGLIIAVIAEGVIIFAM